MDDTERLITKLLRQSRFASVRPHANIVENITLLRAPGDVSTGGSVGSGGGGGGTCPENCPVSITFEGIIFDCLCARHNAFNPWLKTTSPETLNGTAIIDVTLGCGDILACRNNMGGSPPTVHTIGYGFLDCSTVQSESESPVNVSVGCIDGIWTIMAWSNGIYFYGTTTDAGIPAVNEVVCTSDPVIYDDPINQCIQGGPSPYVGRARGGTATINLT